jgi:hypothetical protein
MKMICFIAVVFPALSFAGGPTGLRTTQTSSKNSLRWPIFQKRQPAFEDDYARQLREQEAYEQQIRADSAQQRLAEAALKDAALRQTAKAVDSMTQKVEEFGTVTFSAPIFAVPEKPDGSQTAPFEFGLDYTAEQYFQFNKDTVNARVGSAESTATSLGIGLEVSTDSLAQDVLRSKDDAYNQKVADFRLDRLNYEQGQVARQAFYEQQQTVLEQTRSLKLKTAEAITDPAAREMAIAKAESDYSIAMEALLDKQYPTPFGSRPEMDYPGTDTSLLPDLPGDGGVPDASKAAATVEKLIGQSALTSVTGQTSLSPRTNMVNAYGDKMVQSIFNFLGDPSGAVPFKDKVILFGVATVGVSPGWRSQRDFAADVTIQTGYSQEYKPARIETVRRLLNDRRYPANLRSKVAHDYGLELEFDALKNAKKTQLLAMSASNAQNARKSNASIRLRNTVADEENQRKVVDEAVVRVAEARTALENNQIVQKLKSQKQLIEKLKKEKAELQPGPPAVEEKDETGSAKKNTASAKKNSATPQPSAIPEAQTPPNPLDIKTQELEEAEAKQQEDELEKLKDDFIKALEHHSRATRRLALKAEAVSAAAEALNIETEKGAETDLILDEANKQLAALSTSQSDPDNCWANAPSWLKDLTVDNEAKPIVAGVSPLMETQTLDLESQWRRQDEFALKLAALMQQAGYKGSAGAFYQYAKNRQSDARSTNSSAAVSSYSPGGGLFGFQIGPRLQALADPASKKAGQGRVLERQTFPVLVIFGIDHEDIMPRLHFNCTTNRAEADDPLDPPAASFAPALPPF